MDDLHAAFVRQVTALMKRRRMSVNKLADFAGLGRGHVSHVLSGKSSPTLRTLGKLAEALDVSVPDLLRGGEIGQRAKP